MGNKMEIIRFNKKQLNDNLSEFCQLYGRCFDDYIDEKIVKQRYLEGLSENLYMRVACDKGKIVANYAVAPVKANIYGEEVFAAISLNTMTDPEYSGRGLFVTLARELYADLLEENCSFVYGFPNNLSNPVFISKLGWRNIYEIPTLEYIVENERITHTSIFKTCQLEDVLYKKHINKIEICKDRAYLRWRYGDVPNKKYFCAKIDGDNWIVYKFYGSEINVVERQLDDPAMICDAVDFLLQVAKENEIKKISIWCEISNNEHYYLEKKRFKNNYPIRYFGVKSLNYNKDDLFLYSNWRVNMGDDNIY